MISEYFSIRHRVSVYNLRFELNLSIRMSSLVFNLPKYNSTCPKSTTMNGLSHRGIFLLKFQLVHPGKLAKNQLARSQNPLVPDERTSVSIFTGVLRCGECKRSRPMCKAFVDKPSKVKESNHCLLFCRVYPYLCRAVRNFAQDRGQVPAAKEFYVSFTDVPAKLK